MEKLKVFYETHKKGLKIFGLIIVAALVVTILVNGSPVFHVNQ